METALFVTMGILGSLLAGYCYVRKMPLGMIVGLALLAVAWTVLFVMS